MPSLRPPLGFAHRGGRWVGRRSNGLASFSRSLARGATALESDVRLTSDGVPVLLHDAEFGPPRRRRAIAAVHSSDLPRWLPPLAELYARCGTDFDLSLDVKDPAAAEATIAAAAAAGGGAVRRLWLCGNADEVVAWRGLSDEVRLIDSTRLRFVPGGAGGLGAYAARLRSAGADGINLRAPEWTPAGVEAVHAEGLVAFGWDAQSEAVLRSLLQQGIDGVYSDHVDLMVQVLGAR